MLWVKTKVVWEEKLKLYFFYYVYKVLLLC